MVPVSRIHRHETRYLSLLNPPVPVKDHSQHSVYVLRHFLQGLGVKVGVPLRHDKNERLQLRLGAGV